MPEFHTIRYEVKDRVATVTLARPEKRNAISVEMFEELGAATERQVATAMLVPSSSPPTAFRSARGSISLCSASWHPWWPVQPNTLTLSAPLCMSSSGPTLPLASMSKPTRAAVQGHALGAGFPLALACDLRMAASDVRFGMLEGRYGLIPDLGGMHHLARLVGSSRTKELVWTARTVEGAEAERIGLVNRLVGLRDLPATAEELVRSCIAHSAVAVALTKELISATFARPLADELDREAEAQAAALEGAGSPET